MFGQTPTSNWPGRPPNFHPHPSAHNNPMSPQYAYPQNSFATQSNNPQVFGVRSPQNFNAFQSIQPRSSFPVGSRVASGYPSNPINSSTSSGNITRSSIPVHMATQSVLQPQFAYHPHTAPPSEGTKRHPVPSPGMQTLHPPWASQLNRLPAIYRQVVAYALSANGM